MDKWEVKKGAESFKIKCDTCNHSQANHNKITKGKLTPSNCSRCDCKEFKFKKEDKGKGFFQKN